jgi:hypothetical protein
MKIKILTALVAFAAVAATPIAHAADFVVYSVYQGLDLGNPGEAPQRDYYVNMGAANGLRAGSQLEVSRRIATYDLLNEKLYKDMTLPVGKLKVIHVEANSAICRVDKLAPIADNPALSTRAVMVGDIVK